MSQHTKMRVRVKICGITRLEDARVAAQQGADAVGLVFHPASPRSIEPSIAATIISALPAFVTSVALFRNPQAAMVDEVLEAAPFDLLQFHGAESPEFCASFGRPFIKAVGASPDLGDDLTRFHNARGVLIDHPGGGGTGQVFDWALVPTRRPEGLIVAGGLTPANVAGAIRALRPYAVDVSSGVESAPGIKDASRIRSFIEEVNHVGGH